MKNIDRNIFAAIDLGSNNCRLIITKCSFEDYKIIDTFLMSCRALGRGIEIILLKECITINQIIGNFIIKTGLSSLQENKISILN